jgi:hypothetical protein
LSACPREGRRIGGCRFEARYDFGQPMLGNYTGERSLEMMEVSKARTYVRDVCVRCGKAVERAR